MAKTEEEKAHKQEMRSLEADLKRLQVDQEAAKLRKLVADADLAEWAEATERRYQESVNASDLANYRYNFTSVVDSRSVQIAVLELSVWDRIADPDQPFEIVFHSPGGSVFDGMRLFDVIHGLSKRGGGTHHITTVAQGYAASMASILLQAGDTRVMGRQSYQLIHEISSVAMGSATALEDELATLRMIQAQVVDIYCERSTLTADFIRDKWTRRDWWISANESLELGLVDEIR